MEVVISAILTIVGLVMLCFGGNWLVSGGVAIARKFRISNLVIGMTIVAYGTSTPELAASIAAAGEHSAIILGNIIGSNIANVGMVIGIAAILVPLAIHKSVLRKEIPIMLGVSVLLILISIDGELSTYDGILLLVGLGVFGYYTFKDAMKQRQDNKDEVQQGGKNVYLKSIGLIGLGIGLLYVGAILTVDNAVVLAKEFGLSEKIIGLTVIAIGTSLPELITSIIAIRKGHSDIGVGNIIGSNIYNILMIMGVGATLGGVMISADVYIDYAIMILFSLTLVIGLKTGVINRVVGICLAIGYVAYLVLAFFK
ncbi:energy-coupling factor transport system ATP-binding protein [Marine Group I thaumarchaeote SCGC AAA799-E16]|uniref:Energy-coupling factor transport system ATP-binding protein n=5 Tax=Marine Group I TaxID=905826 RepID=A0A087S654_9ARCH|nr:energy-coupling factor transport system ATP-binding protein [Marine Group I thaumarchaeote SCGC AAA799-N04]KER05966.1 energy-coupling factor transport system ATP-binding protein [Marine Group I thaumarchaeote SCGC AAA799-E16]KFM16635.1 energy-coupling factor transport system ATP-binding protein [Marine Group I thaumarchaeote SCGC AAA799-D11]KFM18688.1 CaCA family Na antiporter protein [Marine Group I thaumarchaeote SCGC RSA3]KFM21208.1 energy-coupling factor transport system ATP-binding prot